MGISFAIPIDEAMRVSEQLRTSGRVIRGRIGVVDRPGHEGRGRVDRPRQGRRARWCATVEAGGPADKAGVEAGDIITKVDGRRRSTSSVDLPRMVGSIKPGTKATLAGLSSRQLPRPVGRRRRARAREGRSRAARPTATTPSRRRRSARWAWPSPTSPMRRSATLKVKSGVRVETRRRRRGARRRARGRRGRHGRQRRGRRAPSSSTAIVAKLDKAKPVTLLVRRGDAAQFPDRPAGALMPDAGVRVCAYTMSSVRSLTRTAISSTRSTCGSHIRCRPGRPLPMPKRLTRQNCPQHIHRHIVDNVDRILCWRPATTRNQALARLAARSF